MDDLQLRSLVLMTHGFAQHEGKTLLKALSPHLFGKACSWWDALSASTRGGRQAEIVSHFGLSPDVSLKWHALLKRAPPALISEVYRLVSDEDRCLLPWRPQPPVSEKPPAGPPLIQILALSILQAGKH